MLYIECLRHNEREKKEIISRKESINLYAERTEAEYAATTYKYLRSPPIQFFFYLEFMFPSPRHAEMHFVALTAETPRLGGDWTSIPASPLGVLSARGFYRGRFPSRVCCPSPLTGRLLLCFSLI